MACDPQIIYKGKEYSHVEFMTMLKNGLIDMQKVKDFVDGKTDEIKLNDKYNPEFEGREVNVKEETKKLQEDLTQKINEIEQETGELVERTLLGMRLSQSNIDAEVKQGFLEEGKRLRAIDTHALARVNAARIIEENGLDAAVRMVKNGELKGAVNAAILGEKWLQLDAALKTASDGAEKYALIKEYNDLLKMIGERQESSGGENSYWASFYGENPTLGLTTDQKIRNWENRASGGAQAAPKEVVEKFKELEKREKELLEKIKELEESKSNEDINEVIEAVKSRDKGKDPQRATKKAKEIADGFRAALKSKPIELKDANGNPILDAEGKPVVLKMQGMNFNELIEVGAKAIEQTGKAIDGIRAISEKIAEQDWYKALSKKDKDAVLKQITSIYKDVDTTQPLTSDTLKELIEKGYDTPEKLIEKLREFYPDNTDRQIRDLITKYGIEAKETQTDIEKILSGIKSVFVKESQLEDALSGKLPFKRVAKKNDKFVDDIRRKTREIKNALKNLNVPEANMDSKWKTRVEATKARLRNAIVDMERAIETGEKIANKKPVKLSNEEIDNLRRELEVVKERYEAAFKEPALTDGQKKILSLERKLENLRFGETKEKVEPEYTKEELDEIKALEDEIAKEKDLQGKARGTEIKSAQEKLLEATLKSKQRQLQNAKDKLAGIPKEQKEKVEVSSIEIDNIQREIDEIKQKIKDQKPKKTEEEKAIERAQKRLDDLRFGAERRAKGKRPLSQEEKDILEQIEEEKILQGKVRSKLTKEEMDLENLDLAIKRVRDLIEKGDLEIKRKEKPEYSDAVLAKKQVYEDVLKELEQARDEAGILEAEQIKQQLEYLAERKKYYENRIAKGDFSKAPKKKKPVTDAIITAKGQLDAVQKEYQKLQYLADEQAKMKRQKIATLITDIWNIPRVQMATGELSFIGVQGRRLTFSELIKNPKTVGKALKTMGEAMWKRKNLDDFMAKIKYEDPQLYHAMKTAKLDLLETSGKISAMDESSLRFGGRMLWNALIYAPSKAIDLAAKTKSYEWLKERPLYEVWERGAVAYGNYLRVKAFSDFYETYKNQYNIEENPKVYKQFADYLNTASGRGSLGMFEAAAEPLSKIMFSPKNTSSEWQLATSPLGLAKLLHMQYQSDMPMKDILKNPAVMEAAKTQLRYVLGAFGVAGMATAMAWAKMGSTDDNKDGTGVELDPTSSDFLKLVFKDGKTVDLFNGQQRYLLLGSRIYNKEVTSSDRYEMRGNKAVLKRAEPKKLNEGYNGTTYATLVQNIAGNKINPTLGFAWDLMTGTSVSKDDISLGIRRNKYGEEVGSKQIDKLLTPIFWNSVINESLKDPEMVDLFGQIGAFAAIINYNAENKRLKAEQEYKEKMELAKKAREKRKEQSRAEKLRNRTKN